MKAMKPHYFWYTLSGLLLVHVQLNLHEFAFFVGAAVLIGLFPIKGVRWWKYALLELAALAVCLGMNWPSSQLQETIGSISGMGGLPFILATVVFSTITFTLVAHTSQLMVARFVFKNYLAGR
jgi:hypothetical protein